MTLRAWEEKDVAAICALEGECFSDGWTEEMLVSTFRRRDFCGILLEINGEIIGYVTATALFEDAELLRIAVKKQSRGKGYGGLLLDAWLQKIKALGAQRALLEVREGNEKAIGLYESRGLSLFHVRERYYSDGEAAKEMQKAL